MKLKEYVEQRIAYSRKLANLGTLSLHSVLDVKSVFRKLYEDFEFQELILLKKIIDEGKNMGEFSNELPEESVKVFLHAIQGLKLRFVRFLKEQTLDDDNNKELESEMNLAAVIFINGMKKIN